jgi:gliding motility-associated-like protein
LTTPVVAGATYSWTGPGNYNSSIHNPTITNSTLADAGTYSITVTIGGCTSDTGTTTVTIDPTPATPTASSNSPVCITNNINLTTPTVAGATYSWIGPGAYTSSAQNPIIVGATGADAGTYSVTVTVGGCTSQQGTTTVVMTANQIPPAVSSNSPVCIGDTIKLFADTIAGAVYSWTNPFFTSALQNPVIINATTANAGTYSLTVTVGGCSSSATTTIVAVNSPPPTPVVSSNSPVCIGSTINLSTPTVSGATYSWTGPNGFASTAQNPSISNVTASDAGTYSLTVSTGGCSSPSATVAVTISPGPSTPIASANTPICVGDSLKLTTAVVAGAVYNWSGPGAYLSSAQNPVIPNAQLNNGGDYILTITVGGCTSVPDTVSVIVNTPPTTPSILNNSPVCSGDTLFLSTPAVANATYNWSGPDNFTSNLQNPTIDSVTAFNAGIYNLTITIGSCSSSPSSAAISVDPSPSAPTIIASDTALCAGSTLNLTTATVPGGTYTWSGPATFQSALQSPSITSIPIQASGIYSLTITVNGCTSAPGTELITVDTVPIIPLVTSNSPACLGGVLTLTADSVAGAVYAWIGPNGILPATTTTATVNGVTTADAGIYKVVIALGGCVSDTGTTTVTTIAPPSIPTASSNSPVCEGTTLNLTTPTVAGATYNWFGPNNYTASTQNPSIAAVPANAGGNYSVVITVGGCSSDSGTTAVVVLPAPAAPVVTSNSPTCIGDTIRLQTALVAGAVYAWTGPNTFSSSLQNPTIANATAADTGIYSLTITANGCTSAPGTTFVSVIVCTDTDGDGIIDAADIDDDNDGILDATENLTAVSNDTDGDGVSDRLDLDSDNDGIADVTEAGGSDPDNDGVVGLGSIIDANGDGLADNLPGSGLSAIDTDNDGRPNFQDLDSDGDSINDLYESGGIQPDANGDGVVDDPDSDNDGLADSSDADNGGALTNPLWDSDADGTPNYTDVDSDNDGVNDGTNGEFPDLNCDDDTISNYLDTDPCQLVIPNGFSPDGDNINDLFVINGLDAYPGTNLKIMNRWGNLVYESSNYDNTWDGVSNRNAVLFGDSKVPPGTYYYVIELTSGQTLPGTTSTTQTGFIEIRY